jgi:hypothetical protein
VNENSNVPSWVGGCLGFMMAMAFTGAGLFIILVSFDLIHSSPENFHAPRMIVACIGLVFFLAGLLMFMGVIFSAEELRHPILLWLQFLLVLLAMAAFSGVFLWVGFGPGEREFQTSASIGPVSTTGEGNSVIGRIMFGGFGLLCGLGTGSYAYTQTSNLILGQFKSIFDQNRTE